MVEDIGQLICWYESREGVMIGPEIFQQTTKEDQSDLREGESFVELSEELS